MKNISKKVKLDMSKYVNPDTGETLDSEMQENDRIIVHKDTGLVNIESKDFVTIDSKAIAYICNVLSAHDCMRFTQMGPMLKTAFNIVSNNTIPHTIQTLSTVLGTTVDETTRFCKRLMKKGLLAYVVCAPSGYTERIYLLNPSVIRKRKTFDRDILAFFKDYSNIV